MAACRSAPAGTRTWRFTDGYDVFTVARGSSAAVAEPYDAPEAPEGTDGTCAVVLAVSVTVRTMERTVVSAVAYSVTVPAPVAVSRPALGLVLATVATVRGDVDQVIGTSGIGVPSMSRTTPETCVASPTLSVVAFAVIETMCTAAPTGFVVAESGCADVVSAAPLFEVVSATSAAATVTSI